MKKIVMTLVAMLSMTMTFAENENMNAANAYTINVNMNSLSRALDLTDDQKEAVNDIQNAFCAEMLNAAAADKSDRKAIIDAAVRRDLFNMHAVLTKEQFRTYRAILNATFVNRNLF